MWNINEEEKGNEVYYNYDSFMMNLNHINVDLAKSVASTDTRLRPDQRAWENGWSDLAVSEKHRLEER